MRRNGRRVRTNSVPGTQYIQWNPWTIPNPPLTVVLGAINRRKIVVRVHVRAFEMFGVSPDHGLGGIRGLEYCELRAVLDSVQKNRA